MPLWATKEREIIWAVGMQTTGPTIHSAPGTMDDVPLMHHIPLSYVLTQRLNADRKDRAGTNKITERQESPSYISMARS